VLLLVVAVSVAVSADVLLISTESGERLHVVGSLAPDGAVTAHESVTVPVNEFDGVTVIVEVPVEPGATEMLPLLLRVKLVLEPLGFCQKSPHPATSTVAASSNVHFPIFIATPRSQPAVTGTFAPRLSPNQLKG